MEDIQNYHQNAEQHQTIKPSIKNSLLLINSLGITIIISFFFGWIFGSPLIVVLSFFGGTGILIGFVSIIIIFLIIFCIVFLFKKATLKKTKFKFYKDKVEYYEGFLVKNRKTIHYDKISNIGQRKGIIEGWFGLGTIFIDTAGFSKKGHELSMKYLENPDQIYDWISKVTSNR
jgi:membrane protein YdbS with pleckstrin-like domain